MSAPDSVNRVVSGPFDVSTLKSISAGLVLPIVICGTIAAGLLTTIGGSPKLAAEDLPRLASLTPDVSSEAVAPAAAPKPSAMPSHGPGDARHQAAAAMLLLLVATARKWSGGEAQRQAAKVDLSVRQTADARRLR